MNKALSLLTFIILFCDILYSQNVPGRYWVQFRDKNNSPYSVSNPSAYLSNRAINRRVAQGISIGEDDLPVNPAYIGALENAGALVLNRSKWMNSVTVYIPDTNVLQQINALTFVRKVDFTAPPMKKGGKPDEKFIGKFGQMDNGSKISGKWSRMLQNRMKNTYVYDYGMSYNQIHMLNGDLLHNLGYRGEGLVIAILDAGFYNADVLEAFDSLWLNSQILGYRDFAEPGGNVFEKSSHGTYVLSIMGANVPGQLIGTAPKADYWLLRSEDESSEYLVEEDNWVSAAEFADSVGADVINSSLGYNIFNDPGMDHNYGDMNGDSTRVTRGADVAASKGIVVVCSVGNSGGSAWQYLGAPSDGDSVMAAGAVDNMGVYANFSSTGPTADGRVKPDLATQGQGTLYASSNGGYFPGNGTSFSSPILAGMTACLWQANPGLGNMQIIEAIRQSASQYNSPDSLLGYGIPDFFLAHQIAITMHLPNISDGDMPTVFPNPAIDEFFLKYFSNDTQLLSIELLDLSGRLVRNRIDIQSHHGENRIRVDLPDAMGQGLYSVRISTQNKVFQRKIVKIHR